MICPGCGIEFKPNTTIQLYCTVPCQQKHYKKRSVVKEKPPEYSCQNCGYKVKLNFYPRKDENKWLEFISNFNCPNCKL